MKNILSIIALMLVLKSNAQPSLVQIGKDSLLIQSTCNKDFCTTLSYHKEGSNYVNITVCIPASGYILIVLDNCANNDWVWIASNPPCMPNPLAIYFNPVPVGGLSLDTPMIVKYKPIKNKLPVLYPNPSTGSFKISLSNTDKKDYKIEVMSASMNGLLVKRCDYTGIKEKEVLIENIPKGNYIVRILNTTDNKLDILKAEIIQ